MSVALKLGNTGVTMGWMWAARAGKKRNGFDKNGYPILVRVPIDENINRGEGYAAYEAKGFRRIEHLKLTLRDLGRNDLLTWLENHWGIARMNSLPPSADPHVAALERQIEELKAMIQGQAGQPTPTPVAEIGEVSTDAEPPPAQLCPSCDFIADNEADLEIHFASAHPAPKPVPGITTTESMAGKAKRGKDREGASYACECGLVLASQTSLDAHREECLA